MLKKLRKVEDDDDSKKFSARFFFIASAWKFEMGGSKAESLAISSAPMIELQVQWKNETMLMGGLCVDLSGMRTSER